MGRVDIGHAGISSARARQFALPVSVVVFERPALGLDLAEALGDDSLCECRKRAANPSASNTRRSVKERAIEITVMIKAKIRF